VAINTSALPQTVSTVINLDMFVLLVGSTALKVLSIPVVSNVGQRMTIKNTASVDVSLAFPSSNVMLFDSLTTTTGVILKTKETISLYWNSAFWIQTVPSNAMPELNTSTINPVANTTNLGICSSQSSGILNIGTGARTKSNGTGEGNINIGTGINTFTTGTVAPTINIGNNTDTTNITEISIGAVNTNTTINGPLTLTGASTVQSISGSGLFTTSSNITTTGTGGFSSAGGDIQATTGKLKAKTLDAVADTAVNTIALTIGSNVVNGNIVIGSALGVGDIAIAGAHLAGGTITIGTGLTSTTINGLIKLKTPIIANAGSTPSSQNATETTLYGGLMWSSVNANYTIPSNINREFFMVIQGVTRTITLPALTIHQIINIKVFSASTMNITAPVVGTNIYPKTGGSVATTYVMPADSTQRFYCDGSSWFGY
jgi:hypothetical protein